MTRSPISKLGFNDNDSSLQIYKVQPCCLAVILEFQGKVMYYFRSKSNLKNKKKPLLFLHFLHTSGYPDQNALIVVFLPFSPSHYNPSAMELVCSYFALICYSDPQKLQSWLLSEFYVFSTLFSASFFPFLVWKKP